MIEAVVFDLDGTLVHSAPDLRAAANRMLGDLGRPPLTIEEVTGFVGNGVPKLVERCMMATGGLASREEGAEALAIFSRHYAAAPADLTRPFPGVAAMLGALTEAGLALGICTNKPTAPAEALLAALDLSSAFGAVIGGDAMPETKPDPKPLLHCIEKLGARPAGCLFVGDSETDAATAANAGIPLALFSGGYRKTPAERLGAALVFNHFDALAPWVLSGGTPAVASTG